MFRGKFRHVGPVQRNHPGAHPTVQPLLIGFMMDKDERHIIFPEPVDQDFFVMPYIIAGNENYGQINLTDDL